MMSNKPKVSIIIRTKNEERWISVCLDAVFNQNYKDFEIIIVDNKSNDRTLDKVKEFDIQKIVSIDQYLPGKALNLGIKESVGEFIVCLSIHCIPVNDNWLGTLVSAIEEDVSYAGVYGRQEPMSFSKVSDKRDLLLVFGLDRKIQKKDTFFHNANSIIRKELWKNIPFDDQITNIEDRLWAKEVIKQGFTILYEPEASVYHYHGIHQDGNITRLENVVKIIESTTEEYRTGNIDPKNQNIIAIIPIKGKQRNINDKSQISFTINAIINSKYIDDIIVATDNKETKNIAEDLGAKCPLLRPASLSEPNVSLEMVQQYTLNEIENMGIYPDIVVHLEETWPFRPSGMIDSMIEYHLEGGFDSVITVRRESGYIWQEDQDGDFKRLDSGDIPRKFKEKAFIGLHGLGCVTYPEFIRKGKLLGENIGLYNLNDYPLAAIEVRDERSAQIAAEIQHLILN